MACRNCKSTRIMSVTAKCSDCCNVTVDDVEHTGYIPEDLGIGGGDYITFDMCLNCGMNQEHFPKPLTELETVPEDQDVIDFFQDHFNEGDSISFIKRLNRRSLNLVIKDAEYLGLKFKLFVERLLDLEYGEVILDSDEMLKLFKENS